MSKIEDILKLAWIERGKGNYDQAKSEVEKAKALVDPKDYQHLGRIYHIYMQFDADHDNFEKALDHNQKSINFYQKSNLKDKVAHAIRHKADLLRYLERNGESEHQYVKALSIYREINKPASSDLANAMRGYAIVLEKNGRLYEAVQSWKEVRGLYSLASIEEGVKEAEEKINRLTIK